MNEEERGERRDGSGEVVEVTIGFGERQAAEVQHSSEFNTLQMATSHVCTGSLGFTIKLGTEWYLDCFVFEYIVMSLGAVERIGCGLNKTGCSSQLETIEYRRTIEP